MRSTTKALVAALVAALAAGQAREAEAVSPGSALQRTRKVFSKALGEGGQAMDEAAALAAKQTAGVTVDAMKRAANELRAATGDAARGLGLIDGYASPEGVRRAMAAMPARLAEGRLPGAEVDGMLHGLLREVKLYKQDPSLVGKMSSYHDTIGLGTVAQRRDVLKAWLSRSRRSGGKMWKGADGNYMTVEECVEANDLLKKLKDGASELTAEEAARVKRAVDAVESGQSTLKLDAAIRDAAGSGGGGKGAAGGGKAAAAAANRLGDHAEKELRLALADVRAAKATGLEGRRAGEIGDLAVLGRMHNGVAVKELAAAVAADAPLRPAVADVIEAVRKLEPKTPADTELLQAWAARFGEGAKAQTTPSGWLMTAKEMETLRSLRAKEASLFKEYRAKYMEHVRVSSLNDDFVFSPSAPLAQAEQDMLAQALSGRYRGSAEYLDELAKMYEEGVNVGWAEQLVRKGRSVYASPVTPFERSVGDYLASLRRYVASTGGQAPPGRANHLRYELKRKRVLAAKNNEPLHNVMHPEQYTSVRDSLSGGRSADMASGEELAAYLKRLSGKGGPSKVTSPPSPEAATASRVRWAEDSAEAEAALLDQTEKLRQAKLHYNSVKAEDDKLLSYWREHGIAYQGTNGEVTAHRLVGGLNSMSDRVAVLEARLFSILSTPPDVYRLPK